MTSKIKVDNIENQCGGAVVTKCGATTTIAGTNVNATTVTATNVVGSTAVKSDNIQAADGGNIINQCGTTITLGASGDTINLASGASQSGFGRTGTVDWDTTPKTATFSAVSGDGYFCNTTSSAFTVNLPAGSAGAIVSLADYAATWQTNNLTVSPNGTDKIGSFNQNVTLSTEGQSVTFVYVDSTQGWINTMDSTSNVRGAPTFITATGGTITCCGDYKIHTFTGPGTFCVSAVGSPAGSTTVDYLVIAGGGAGSGDRGGGGGAGGFRYSSSTFSIGCAPGGPLANPTGLSVTATGYPITIGGGGTAPSVQASSGSTSTFSTITSAGGGFGGGNSPSNGGNGGSGGGARDATCAPGGTGNTPPVSPPQGNRGGNYTGNQTGAGGGGAIGIAQTQGGVPEYTGGAGGGLPTAFGSNGVPCGSFRYYAGGGGGGANIPGSLPGGAGGIGGGGTGGSPAPSTAGSGTTNTGGGGGGGGDGPGTALGGAGGSGIVIIRYKFQ